MKKIVMLFLATMVLAGASFAQATTSTDNGMKSDTMKSDSAAPKKAKKASASRQDKKMTSMARFFVMTGLF